MYQSNFSVYLGREDENIFIGFTTENGFFAILKVDEGLSKEKGRELLKKISVELDQTPVNNLDSFETLLADKFKEADIPSGFSCAAGYFQSNILLLKTVGTGQIYLKRGTDFAKLIDGTNSASGYVSKGDFLIFTTREFVQALGQEDQLKNALDNRKPHDLLEVLTPRLKTQDDAGMVALFISFDDEKQTETELKNPPPPPQADLKSRLGAFLTNARTQLKSQDRKKTWTFIGVGLILIVFVWSVILGYQRRVGAQSQKRIETAKEIITEELNQAEEVVFLNLPRATALINQAKENLANLKKEVKDPDNSEIQSLEKLIISKEGQILKKEQRQAEEFFDLSIENENASGQQFYLDGENLSILDSNGTIYLLSLSKKSLDKINSAEAKGASIVVTSNDRIYVFRKGAGVFELPLEGKSKKVIDNDPEWKNVTDIASYNGNLYLLDRGANEVYKYLVAEGGFSNKSSYFQAGQQKPNLQNATSLAIDASVYIGLPQGVLKYVAGLQDSFGTSFPEEDYSLTKIFTSKDVEKVYGWDKNRGTLYIIDKSGTYERQINSSVLSKATDFAVFEKNAYLLVGSKIYRLSVE